MPELPEVETVVRDLRPLLTGRRLTAVRLSKHALRRPWSKAWSPLLIGRRVEEVRRRGKWIVVALDGAHALVFHLGMTGQLRVVAAAEPVADHTHLVIDLDDSRQLRFRDVRRFGSATLFRDAAALGRFFDEAELGPEPFDLDPAAWREALRRTDRAIKAVLLDQTVVAGVGNIYADESLFEARLHPARLASGLSAAEAGRLRKAVATVLARAIEKRGATIRDYVGGSGQRGGYQEEFRAYKRTGQPCPRCGTPIACLRLAGRSTHYCPRCQPVPVQPPWRITMSYRAFKRLLGETSLERKCRFLFGAFILLLIILSFSFYSRQTESLAYDQLTTSSRLLVPALVAEPHYAARPGDERAAQVERAMAEVRGYWDDKLWPKERTAPESSRDARPHNGYSRWFIKPDDPEKRAQDSAGNERLREFQNDPNAYEYNQQVLSQGKNYYYAAIRASDSCIGCHYHEKNGRGEATKAGDLIAVLKIEMATGDIEDAVHRNRALLLTIGIITALLIMGGSFVIVRYVIVKPVKHLKEVSDAISAGELNVRSEIQTGDEFEDFSHAFNRMLRNLVSMQDRLRKVNADLDRKVDELAQANMALYESNRLKGDFLATMSHELRTPLNSILGFSEVLVSSPGLNDKQQRWLHNIQSSGERLLTLINDILDLAKIEAGKMQVRLSEFSAYDVCEGLLAMFRPLAEKKNIELRSQLDRGIPPLRQDVVKLQQILSNLLSNAIKFTPEGGRVLLKAEADPLYVVLTVTDTGVGIAPEEQELVFEKFRQSGNPMTREHAGTGLGLSIVRELSKLLGGEVTLQSELGRGSTFTVRLPLQLSEEPRLEFDLAHEGVDLSKAQRVDVRLYAGAAAPVVTRLDTTTDTKVEGK